MTVRRLASRLLALFREHRLDHELENEIQAHLELAERDLIAGGLSPTEARRAARLRFGHFEQIKEEHRDQRSSSALENLLRDLHHGARSVTRNPGFSAAVIGVLALGIGANLAMFSIVDAVLLKPLPFPEPGRIVRVWEAPRPGAVNDTIASDFLEWKRLASAFDALAAENSLSVSLTGAGEPLRLTGKAVTGDYFRVFPARVHLGRTLIPEDERPDAAPPLVLSHAAWRNYFGADPLILTRRPLIDGAPHRIVGVLAPGVFDRDRAQFWTPLAFTPEQRASQMHWLTVHGRLRSGVTPRQAIETLEPIHAAIANTRPAVGQQSAIVVESLDRLLVGDGLRRSISVAFGAVAFVLLIACANVANLLLAKGAARRKELAVRAALGASRSRLTAQLLTETLVLCALGGAGGILLASALLSVARTAIATALPYTSDIAIDSRVAAFGALLTLCVALLAGALPALRMSLGSVVQPMNQGARGSSGGHARLRGAIVVCEIALSLVLVCGAVLLLRTFLKLYQIDAGVRVENIITTSVDLPLRVYATPERAALFYESAAARLAAAPAVSEAALASALPLQWITNGEGILVPGIEKPLRVRLKRVDPAYFSTTGIPILSGRGIAATDRAGAPPVIVINQALAARLADVARISDPVGRSVRLSVSHYAGGGGLLDVAIAGVIRSERVASPGVPDPPVAYIPLAQLPATHVKILVRTGSDPSSVVPAIREAVREVDPNLPLGEVATMEQVRDRTLSGVSRPTWLIGAFAALAAVLAALGLYGVLAHAVAQQRREIGIRMALGARASDVLSRVLRHACSMIGAGLILGLLGAVALTRLMRNMLYEVSPLDPIALASASLAMACIGLLAGFIPAARATRVDPATTLREEG